MNKAFIKKYKPEFEHWLNEGKILAYHKKDDDPKWWTDQECVDFSGVDNFSYIIEKSLKPDYVLIVIDDEYVDFRKAMAEGKTIQHISATTGEWVDFNKGFKPTPSYTFLATPEYYRIKLEEPEFKVGDWVRAPSGCIYQINETNILHGTKHFTPWQPEPGEWCYFWDDNYTIAILAKFSESIDNKFIEHNGNAFSYCQPFTNELPTHLKDK